MTGPAPINQGTCVPWCDAEQILACCHADFGTDIDLDTPAQIASDILYRLSGHQYPGICEATVRPCSSNTSCFTPNFYPSRAWHSELDGHWYAARDCSCRPLSKIRLAGYPVREILEVSIDGEIIDPADYRLDQNRYLVRLNGGRWPACQRLDLDEGIGTWFVHYSYGLEPPLGAAGAAAQLACAIAKACIPGEDCELPVGTVRYTRQGISVETQSLGLWLVGAMKTGMPLVDMYLSVWGQIPGRRRTALMVPEADPWPLRQ
jgi:hypothetical protein